MRTNREKQAPSNILWSNGKNLHLIAADGTQRKLLAEPLIDSVKWLEPFAGPIIS